MTNPEWNKRRTDPPFYEGVRVAELGDFVGLDDLDLMNIEIIIEAMECGQLLIFEYSGSSRIVAPFALGVSSEGNPLLRGYQLEGVSRSGKGPGWRIFQVREMQMVDNYQDYYEYDPKAFDQNYPWIYAVYKMVEGGIGV